MGISVGNATFCMSQITANNSVCLDSRKTDPGFWVIAASEFILFVFGLPLNTWVLWLILRDTGDFVVSDIFFLNLIAMDTYYCLVSQMYCLGIYFSSMFLILLSQFSDGLIMTGQPLLMCCICVERYLAVVHPIIFLKCKPVRYRVMCSGVVWMLSVGIGAFVGYTYPRFPIYPLLAVQTAVLAVDLFCSFSILKVLRQPGPGDREREGMNPTKRRAFKTVFIILVMTIVCYLPLLMVDIAELNGLIPESFLELAYGITFFIFMSGSVVQPLLHLIRAGKLPCCWCSW